MRIWISGPRLLGGLIRPGISFDPRELTRPSHRARQLKVQETAESQPSVFASVVDLVISALAFTTWAVVNLIILAATLWLVDLAFQPANVP